MNQTAPSPTKGTTPSTNTAPRRGTTPPTAAPGNGSVPRSGTRISPSTGTVPSPGTPARPDAAPIPGTGTGTMPTPGATPAPGMGTGTMPRPGATPTPGMGTGTMPRPNATPTPGMGTSTMPRPNATPTPGMGTGTMPVPNATPTPGMGTGTMPGMITTPAPGTGNSQTRPGMGTPPAPGAGANISRPPYTYEINTGTTTPPVTSGPMQPSGRPPMNPQSMTTPSSPNHNNSYAMPNNLSGIGIPGGMQPDMNPEMPCYYNPNIPYMSYAPYQGIPNMYLPNSNPYNVPMGIPLFPLYGYDNSADLDHDMEYMKQLYPKTARAIQKEIDNECDKMEFDGSIMFDEYPDKEYLDRLVDQVYERIKQLDEEPQVEMNSLYFYPPKRNPNYLRDIVSLLLLSEIFNRRRRYRGRKRWF